MALETLKNTQQIGGFKILVMDNLRNQFPEKFNESGAMDWQWFEKNIRPNCFIYLREDKNSLSFTLQNGPVGTHGINGCQYTARRQKRTCSRGRIPSRRMTRLSPVAELGRFHFFVPFRGVTICTLFLSIHPSSGRSFLSVVWSHR